MLFKPKEIIYRMIDNNLHLFIEKINASSNLPASSLISASMTSASGPLVSSPLLSVSKEPAERVG